MTLSLANGIACCDCNGAVILLDVRRDRYFALGPESGRALLGLAHGEASTAGRQSALDALVTRGVLRDTSDLTRPTILTVAPAIDSSILDADAPRGRLDPGAVGRAARALATATVGLRARSFAKRLTVATRQRPADERDDLIAVFADYAARFEKARRYLPFDRSCLRDSFALLDFLRHLPARPRIVFGVRTDPFRAHCWIQHEGLLLNEVVDLANLFTPILVA